MTPLDIIIEENYEEISNFLKSYLYSKLKNIIIFFLITIIHF